MERGVVACGEVQVVSAAGEAQSVHALQAEVEDVALERRVVAEVQIGIRVAGVIEWAGGVTGTRDADGVQDDRRRGEIVPAGVAELQLLGRHRAGKPCRCPLG